MFIQVNMVDTLNRRFVQINHSVIFVSSPDCNFEDFHSYGGRIWPIKYELLGNSETIET